jgi:hypothetical protein
MQEELRFKSKTEFKNYSKAKEFVDFYGQIYPEYEFRIV